MVQVLTSIYEAQRVLTEYLGDDAAEVGQARSVLDRFLGRKAGPPWDFAVFDSTGRGHLYRVHPNHRIEHVSGFSPEDAN